MHLSVREIRKEELKLVIDYFLKSSAKYLRGMGADNAKLPSRTKWLKELNLEFGKPANQKEYYYLIWLEDDKPIGHSNINHIDFGKTAKMHLHLWQSSNRMKGMGEVFIKKSIPFYFNGFNLQTLICEPYAYNPAPNKVLPKLGFEFVKQYETIPGASNYRQQVRRYILEKDRFLKWIS